MYSVLVSSCCTNNSFLVYTEIDGLNPGHDYFLDMYYYDYFDYHSDNSDEYGGDIYYNITQKENIETLQKDIQFLNDKLHEEELLANMINDINSKYGIIHPKIKSELIKNYKISAKALGNYFPEGDIKKFSCYYDSRYKSHYSNYNVNIEVGNDIYINNKLNNKKETIKISRNQ